ncbi:hypothetical protein DUNSADRAFT_17381 [Dunaliella salina]|uniref:Encoded protein n=1 Tax=Dunaliella salina TaxID=3046 RepID=A0ABQ7G1V5_DUNSA|nr:hypothetical protein DUNSADRAFT_17381 [Dunaliella salina]|eukprot:KAF5828591.1 hypothetical protein DUNSADRAFT_17381 [Dunaliella salina]
MATPTSPMQTDPPSGEPLSIQEMVRRQQLQQQQAAGTAPGSATQQQTEAERIAEDAQRQLDEAELMRLSAEEQPQSHAFHSTPTVPMPPFEIGNNMEPDMYVMILQSWAATALR